MDEQLCGLSSWAEKWNKIRIRQMINIKVMYYYQIQFSSV